jgi:hypothetical protein
MSGAILGTVGSVGATLKRCTTAQVSIGCCTSTANCGALGGGVVCATKAGTFTPLNC